MPWDVVSVLLIENLSTCSRQSECFAFIKGQFSTFLNSVNRYRRVLETCPQAKTSKSGHAIFYSFFRRVRAKILASTFGRFRLYRLILRILLDQVFGACAFKKLNGPKCPKSFLSDPDSTELSDLKTFVFSGFFA